MFLNVTFTSCASHGSNCSNSHHAFCAATNNGGSGFASGRSFSFCAADTNTSHGFQYGGTSATHNCVAFANGGDGFLNAFAGTTSHCLSAGNGGDGFESSSGASPVFANCVAYGNTGHGFKNSSSPSEQMLLHNCALGANTAGTTSGMFQAVNVVSLSGDPFVNSGSGDYRLNPGSAAAWQLVGQAQTNMAGVTGGTADIGHYQMPAGLRRLVDGGLVR